METPSNDSRRFQFSARILRYILHQYGTDSKACTGYHIVSQHLFQLQTNNIYNQKSKKEIITSLVIGSNKYVW